MQSNRLKRKRPWGRVLILHPSLKSKTMLELGSVLDAEAAVMMDWEPRVKSYTPRAFSIPFAYKGRDQEFAPSFHVIWQESPGLLICAWHAGLLSPRIQAQLDAARGWCTGQDWRFDLMTEVDLRSGFKLQNIKLLTRYARYPLLPQIEARIWRILTEFVRPLSLRDVGLQVAPDNLPTVYAHLLHLAYYHRITIPVESAVISPNTLVELPHQS
jgi:hypothetical protein